MAKDRLAFTMASIMVLAPFLHEEDQPFDLKNMLRWWPILFIGIYMLFTVTIAVEEKKNRFLPRLTEGVLLVQSFSIVYWLIDTGFFHILLRPKYYLIGVGILPVAASLLLCFTKLRPKRWGILLLSHWSMTVMSVFSIEFLVRTIPVFLNTQKLFGDPVLYIVEAFVGGIVVLYMAVYLMMLLLYIPPKHGSIRDWKLQIRDSHRQLIERFIGIDAQLGETLIAICYLSSIFAVNLRYHLVHRSTAISFVFVTMPLTLWVAGKITKAAPKTRTDLSLAELS